MNTYYDNPWAGDVFYWKALRHLLPSFIIYYLIIPFLFPGHQKHAVTVTFLGFINCKYCHLHHTNIKVINSTQSCIS